VDEILAAFNRALTAYDDCPPEQDAHTLAASRYFGIDYDEVSPIQRAYVKHLTFAARYQSSARGDDRKPIVLSSWGPSYHDGPLSHWEENAWHYVTTPEPPPFRVSAETIRALS